MDKAWADIFAHDLKEAVDWRTRAMIRAKLFAYALIRPLADRRLRRAIAPALSGDPILPRVDLLLENDGGMFKHHAYGLTAQIAPLRGATIVVPGVGYGRNLFQLAAFRPREIFAFDLYDYPEEWVYFTRELKARFGTTISFAKGDFDALPPGVKGRADAVISDAVLEHVPDLPAFMASSAEMLRPGGAFFASFGPLWYGPGGDHVDWGDDHLYDHLLLDPAAYRAASAARVARAAHDSCDPGFMAEEELFSYLSSAEYVRGLLDHPAFARVTLAAKISPRAIAHFRRHPETHAALNRALASRGVPRFDRFCGGFYAWLRRK